MSPRFTLPKRHVNVLTFTISLFDESVLWALGKDLFDLVRLDVVF